MTNLLHYDLITEFKRQHYKDLLGPEHLTSGEIKISKVSFPDNSEDSAFNFWGYTLERDGIKYLLPSQKDEETVIKDIKKTLPILVQHSQKISSSGIVYQLIRNCQTVRFTEEQRMSFKQMIDTLSSMKHSNHEHQTLLWLMAYTQMTDRANFRISTPPGFGKDSTVTIFGNLIGNAATMEDPTLAKMELGAATLKWLAVNEVVDLSKASYRNIEQFLLTAGDHKPVITKRSRSFGGVGEFIDVSNFSLSLLYNDIDCYSTTENYFDYITKKAVLDRFPPFRLYGVFQEDFNEVDLAEAEQYKEQYKDLIYTFMYYRANPDCDVDGWTTDVFDNYPERWKTNIGKLLLTIDKYSETKEEYDHWVGVTLNAMKDYEAMLRYPVILKEAVLRIDDKRLQLILEKLKYKSFLERNMVLKEQSSPQSLGTGGKSWEW